MTNHIWSAKRMFDLDIRIGLRLGWSGSLVLNESELLDTVECLVLLFVVLILEKIVFTEDTTCLTVVILSLRLWGFVETEEFSFFFILRLNGLLVLFIFIHVEYNRWLYLLSLKPDPIYPSKEWVLLHLRNRYPLSRLLRQHFLQKVASIPRYHTWYLQLCLLNRPVQLLNIIRVKRRHAN